LVLDKFGDAAGYGKDVVDGWGRSACERAEEGEQASLLRVDCEPGDEIVAKRFGVVEGEDFKAGIEKEVEGVDGLKVGDQINLDGEFRRGIEEEHIGLLVLVRIKPPLEDAAVGFNFQFVLEDRGAALESGAKLDGLRANEDRSLILIVGPVVESDFQSHIPLLSAKP
jgi:hypothetical protein